MYKELKILRFHFSSSFPLLSNQHFNFSSVFLVSSSSAIHQYAITALSSNSFSFFVIPHRSLSSPFFFLRYLSSTIPNRLPFSSSFLLIPLLFPPALVPHPPSAHAQLTRPSYQSLRPTSYIIILLRIL